jgi:flagellar basal body-associated protein FliL
VSFPLENEGKIIVKEKIRKEINQMLHKRKIKGQITDVYIHSIIGG